MIFLPISLNCHLGLSHFSRVSVLNCYILYFPFSLYHVLLYLFFSLCLFAFSMPSCCLELSGCTAKPNSLSHSSSHVVSYDCGCAVSSIFSPWICGKDCNISEVSWSDSVRFLPFSSFHPINIFVFLDFN